MDNLACRRGDGGIGGTRLWPYSCSDHEAARPSWCAGPTRWPARTLRAPPIFGGGAGVHRLKRYRL